MPMAMYLASWASRNSGMVKWQKQQKEQTIQMFAIGDYIIIVITLILVANNRLNSQ